MTTKKTTKHYISSFTDVERLSKEQLKKDRLVLLGDVILGSFVEHMQDDILSDRLESEYLLQQPRIASSFINSMVKKEHARLNLYAELQVVNALKEAGAKKSNIYMAADSILRYIKFFTMNEHGVIVCVSPMESKAQLSVGYLVEEYKYSKGELIGFTERRYSASTFATELDKHIKETLKSFSAELQTQIKICGPNTAFTIESLKNLNAKDIHKKIFSNLIGSGFAFDTTKTERFIPHLAVLCLCTVAAAVMVMSGQSKLGKAQAQYQSYITGFEALYSKGRAPIELVEKRVSYVQELEQAKTNAYRLPLLVSAIAKVKLAAPDINLVAEEITYLVEKPEGDNAEDYKVVLRFDKKPSNSPEEELKQWQSVFTNFSKEMQGISNVKDSPLTIGTGADKAVFVMTIVGNFEAVQL